MRNSLAFVSYKDRKEVAASLKPIYRAANEQQALSALEEFEARWGARYPLIAKSWRANWARINPFFGFPDEIRRAIYTTNTIESLNYSLRKIIKNRSLFPNEEALAALPCAEERVEEVDDADPELEARDGPIRDHLRGASAARTAVTMRRSPTPFF